MFLSRISRSIARSSRGSLFNAVFNFGVMYVKTPGCDAYGARTTAVANQFGGAESRNEHGLGFLNAYHSSIGAEKKAVPSFSPVLSPNFANPSFARFFSTDVPRKINYEFSDAKGDSVGDNVKNVLRPLSPHLFIYQPQYNSILSILHRISGVYLTGAYLLFYLVYMKMGSICFTYPSFYQTAFYLSKLNSVALETAALASVYYVYHGIRHMSMDGIKEIMADYVHHKMTRTGMMVLWRLFLIIVIADSFLYLSHLK
ncbi:Succinate dehydrogenase subunit 3-2 mitochondrial [Bienertia sinuspersici]